jgi:hypothetical protein
MAFAAAQNTCMRSPDIRNLLEVKNLLLGAALACALATPAFATTPHHRPAVVYQTAPVSDGSEGYRRATSFEQIKAICEAYADGRPQPGYFVAGNSAYVGMTSFAYGVGGLVRHARAYDQCMTVHGYVHSSN